MPSPPRLPCSLRPPETSSSPTPSSCPVLGANFSPIGSGASWRRPGSRPPLPGSAPAHRGSGTPSRYYSQWPLVRTTGYFHASWLNLSPRPCVHSKMPEICFSPDGAPRRPRPVRPTRVPDAESLAPLREGITALTAIRFPGSSSGQPQTPLSLSLLGDLPLTETLMVTTERKGVSPTILFPPGAGSSVPPPLSQPPGPLLTARFPGRTIAPALGTHTGNC